MLPLWQAQALRLGMQVQEKVGPSKSGLGGGVCAHVGCVGEF
jgi:hypothetical protein